MYMQVQTGIHLSACAWPSYVCQDHIKNKNLNEGNNNIEDKSKISFTPLKDTVG